MPTPISACLIVRDDASTIEECLKSIRPHVDELVVVDTGSVDETPEIVRKYADRFELYTGCNDEQGRIASFCDARNRSFELASNDWVVWADGDDVVRGAENFRRLAGSHDGSPVSVMFPYEYAHDGSGNPTVVHYRERLVYPRKDFKWVGDVHEVLICDTPSSIVRNESVRYVHRRPFSTKPREPGRNLRILNGSYARKGDSDPRVLYYLGMEQGNNGLIDEAIGTLERYLQVSHWDDEKFMACRMLVNYAISRADYQVAQKWALQAVTIKPEWPEGYYDLARAYYFMAQRGEDPERNWTRCVHFAVQCVILPPAETVLFVNPTEKDVEIHRYLNVALSNLGRFEEALESARTALAKQPGDPQLRHNERFFTQQIAVKRVTDAVEQLVKVGHIPRPRADRIVALLHGEEPRPAPSAPPPADGALRVSLYVGPGVEPWNPVTWGKTGLGGSETAVAEMGRRLAAMGHSVTVYGHCGGELEGVFDGVAYVDHSRFGPHECDVLITSRRPQAVDAGVRAKATLCWVHDIHCGPQLTHERALKIDKFLCLTEWHKQFFLSQYSFVHPDQVVVTRNGIDLGRFAKEAPRDPHRAVYSSSPDRGLPSLLMMWPKVRARVPDATLHVYYGFENWLASASDAQRKNIEAMQRHLKDLEPHGVTYHGRVNQSELADAFLASGVWTYPTWFSETSCITAMEAQAAGLAIVTSPVAALRETVGDRGAMIEGDWLSEAYQDAFVEATVRAMTGTSAEQRASLRDYAASKFGWDTLAKEWDAMFRQVISDVERDVVPPYQPSRAR